MKLTIYNGSPRGTNSNSQKIADLLGANFDSSVQVAVYQLKNTDKHDEVITEDADVYFMVFPLYVDIAPYAVKVFFEKMEQSKELYKNKPFYFFIHSGFPEAKQSRLLERYLKYFCKLIGANCMGVCITGNSESIRMIKSNSKRMKKITENMKCLANDILQSKPFNKKSIEYFKGMETLPKAAAAFLKVVPVINKGFDYILKRQGCFEKRYDKPYA